MAPQRIGELPIDFLREDQSLSRDDVLEMEDSNGVSGKLPTWGGQYPPRVIPQSRRGYHVTDSQGRIMVDGHQEILSVSVGAQNPTIEQGISDHHLAHPGVDLVDTTQAHPTIALLKRDLVRAFRPYGRFRAQLAASGTGANNQAYRLCTGALGGPENAQVIAMENGYGGADALMNAICDAAGWKGVTSFPSPALILKLDGSNFDEVFREVQRSGKKPLWHTEDGVQGVGGFHVINPALMRAIAERVSDMGGRKIYDDVQDGVRNGKGLIGLDLWGDRDNPKHRPDAVTIAKWLGNGRGIAAVMVSEDVLDTIAKSGKPGATFDTFNQPIDGVVAGRGVIQMSVTQGLWENCEAQGQRLRANLSDLPNRFPEVVAEIVGTGALTGIRLRTAAQVTAAFNAGPDNGVLFAKGINNVIRLPLQFTTPEDIVDEMSGCFTDTIKAVAGK